MAEKSGMQFVEEDIDPEIREYETWFASPERGNGSLHRMERELIRSFLWWKYRVKAEEEEENA